MQNASDKEFVKSRYPDATAVRHQPVFEFGRTDPLSPEFWEVSLRDLNAEPFGVGPTEAEAWCAAARNIREATKT